MIKKLFAVIITSILIGILLIGVSELPDFGEANVPSNNYVSKLYLEEGLKDTGAKNLIAGIILDYRAFDTFIEAGVLFTGCIVVIMCLKKEKVKNE
ncbi:hydrogen gas-evolving membrane-bound hydrogenase subunit E [Peptostreptococcaceae bacterium AGR-M142]